jgi:DNA replication protein DnaC
VFDRLLRNRRELTLEELSAMATEEQEAARRDLEDRLRLARIPKRFWAITFEEIQRRGIPSNIRSQFEQAQAFADRIISNVQAGKGLLLAGTPGTLKTTTATAVIRAAIELRIGGLFVSMPGLPDIIGSLAKTNREELARFQERLRSVPLLLLDDFGGEGDEKWVKAKVDGLITDRWHDVRSIIITTNLTADELKKVYSERVIDRLRNSCAQVDFVGASLRSRAT